jgi:hypothetical protein
MPQPTKRMGVRMTRRMQSRRKRTNSSTLDLTEQDDRGQELEGRAIKRGQD